MNDTNETNEISMTGCGRRVKAAGRIAAALVLAASLLAAGCGRRAPEAPANATANTTENATENAFMSAENGTGEPRPVEILWTTPEDDYHSVCIPCFEDESPETSRAVEQLNRELYFLSDLYTETMEKSDGRWVEIHKVAEDAGSEGAGNTGSTNAAGDAKDASARYLQFTVYYAVYPKDATEGDLLSLAYDRFADVAIFPRDALKRTGIAGDELSLRVHQAYTAQGYTGRIEQTRMQGFVLDADGSVQAVYMKLTLRPEGAEEPVAEFYAYDPVEGRLTPLDIENHDNL